MRFKKAYDEFGDALYKGWIALPTSAKNLSCVFTIGYMFSISRFPYHAVALYLIVYFELVALLLAAVRHKDKFMMGSANKLESWLKIQKRGAK